MAGPRTERLRLRGRSTIGAGALALVAVLALTACLPVHPSVGRATNVRRVLVLGDSMTYGLFGTTPRVHVPLTRAMSDRGLELRIEGYPAETPIDAWPGNAGWIQRLQSHVSAFDPDMVVIQSTLFPDPDDPDRRALYLAAMRALLDIAGSRGAHVYLVSHATPPGAAERHARDVAQSLQAQAAAGRGIYTIPLDWWLGACDAPFASDGWHLSAKGQDCHTLAITAAVDQLRGAVG